MKKSNPIDDLQEIRKLMENSSKFLSLSGLSGVFAGTVALAGALVAYFLIDDFKTRFIHYMASGRLKDASYDLEIKLFAIAIIVLLLAVGGGIVMTAIKARKGGEKLLSPLTFRMLRSLMVPLFFGGIFIIGLYYQGLTYPLLFYIIPPSMLIFYGMALLNVSKYVPVDIKYLALSEMLLGVILVFVPQYGLLFWAIGFGLLHIVYGTLMYFKYDYKKENIE